MKLGFKKKNFLEVLGIVGTTTAMALPVSAAAEMKAQPDGSWVSLSGQVAFYSPGEFTLDYGEGTITVETDDWDDIGDALPVNEGDKVTVYGRVDDGFYQSRKIEAGSIFIDDLDTMVTAPLATDEEAVMASHTYLTVPADYDLQAVGLVTSTSGREFTIDTGLREVTVDTWQLDYNPLDNDGLVKIEKGDYVSVSGDLDNNVFDENEISAETIIDYN
ncbi:MAG: hypothetical protein RI556_13340 [Hydrogenovibrio sp.]|uniref:hypothetical protein n=1 Tax=Hydrogenovibrio sp. TaxID=2065821 RepID=UPI0028700898|nr:hypothetical protein [Hydrogenovibrio sp.]MDR9500155.1 hypothetical protein [Hydrogenovibrio sp.]